MKTYVLFLLSVAAVFSLAGCTGSGPTRNPATVSTPASTISEPKIQEIKNRGSLIVSVKKEEAGTGQHRDIAHFQKRDFEISIAKAIAKRLLGDENKIEVKMFPLADRVPAVERGEVDLAISAISVTEDLKKVVNFSQPYAWEGLSLMTKKGAGIGGMEDLGGQTVGSNTEGRVFFGDELVKISKDRGLAVTAKSYDSFEEAASAVEIGQIRAQVGRRINMLVYMTQKPGVFELAGGPLTIQEYGIAVKKGNNDLLAVVNSVISDLKKSGEINQMAEKAGFPLAHIGSAPAMVSASTPLTPTGSGAGTGSGGGTGGGGGKGSP